MESLIHLPLEPYGSRYTEFLATWERQALGKYFTVRSVVPPRDGDTPVVMDIQTGSVLDATQRPLWAMSQVRELLLSAHPDRQKVYCSDFYHPGLDALAYSRRRFSLSAFCWAQTFDRHDFTCLMQNWMRPWEVMAFELYDLVFVASPILKELIVSALPHVEDKVRVVGLPYDSTHVRAQWSAQETPDEEFDVVYSSRWDTEKRPNFFLDLCELRDDLRFVVCTGNPDLKGNDTSAVQRALRLEEQGKLTIRRHLKKARYFGHLSRSKVQFNCGMQDWVAFTLLDALTFGCQPLYPNHRSFPEALHYSEPNLYRPGSLPDANAKLSRLLQGGAFIQSSAVLAEHDGSLNRIAQALKNL